MTNAVIAAAGRIAVGKFGGSLADAGILVTLLHEMLKRDSKRGLTSLCIGAALAVER